MCHGINLLAAHTIARGGDVGDDAERGARPGNLVRDRAVWAVPPTIAVLLA
jgi:hypothetical protein